MRKALRYIFLLAAIACAAPFVVAKAADSIKSVSIENTDRASADVQINGTEIELQATTAMKFEIFSITGQLVRVVNVAPGQSVKIDLAKGFYIIKCDSWTRRVLLK